jgi:hypothetical protein
MALPFQASPSGYVFEFGTYTGSSMSIWMDMANKYNPNIKGFIAFDSFEGLPEEDAKIVWRNPDWKVGEFDSRDYFKVKTPEEVQEKLLDKWKPYTQDKNTYIEFITGFYEKSLTDELGKHFQLDGKVCSFCHIDVDIYLSAKQCLDWLFRNNLVVPNAVFRFDDLLDTNMWVDGESLALKEVTEQYNLKWDRIGLNVFLYRGINS